MKKGVCIIECLADDDPGSEGRFLKHMFKLMGIASRHIRVNTIDDLLRAVEKSKFQYVHISTHGVLDKDRSFGGWWTEQGPVGKSKASALRGKLKCRAIISTACKSGSKWFGSYVVNKLGTKYFIGPQRSPRFRDAILFSHLFYHKLFFTKRGVRKAFASYEDHYKNPNGFRLFQQTQP